MPQIKQEIYNSLISHGLFPEEQKRYCKCSRGEGYQLYIDQHIFKESQKISDGVVWKKKHMT